jgi:hypothetical protein
MFSTYTSALSAVCVQCPIWLFLQFLDLVLSWYGAQVLSKTLLSDFEMIPVAPIITGVALAFTFDMR